MEEVKTNAGQGLGIAGLILGCVAIPLAILGCTSVLGLILGSTGIILSAVGLSQASRANGVRGLPVGGLIVSIIGTVIAMAWLLFFAQVAHEGGKWWSKEGAKIMEDFGQSIDENLDDATGDLGDEMEELGGKLEDKLENLEWDEEWEAEWKAKWGSEITEEEFSDVLESYEDVIQHYLKLVEAANKGDIGAVAEYVKVSAKAVALAAKIAVISPRFTDEQMEEFEKLQYKYKQAIEEAEEN